MNHNVSVGNIIVKDITNRLQGSMCGIIPLSVIFLTVATTVHAYSVVTVSTVATAGLETQFIASTTNQYLSNLVVNPFFAGTYQIQLLGQNPNYNPPTPAPTTLEAALSLGATVYVYGFANGMTYQNGVDEGLAITLSNLCSSATNFTLVNTTTATFDTNTCLDAIQNVLDQLFNVDLSTPTVLPPQP